MKRLLCVLGGCGILWGTVQGQVSPDRFSFSLADSTDEGTVVKASGWMEMDRNSGELKAKLFNDSTNPAVITQFYLLKPEDADGNRLDLEELAEAPNGEWEARNQIHRSVVNEFDPLLDTGLYLGAQTRSAHGIAEGQDGFFTFDLEKGSGDIDLNSYFAESVPHFFIRWQSVGGDGEESAKSYGWYSPTPVPEPALIGWGALAGLGSLLWLRKRTRRERLSSKATSVD